MYAVSETVILDLTSVNTFLTSNATSYTGPNYRVSSDPVLSHRDLTDVWIAVRKPVDSASLG